MMVNEIKILQNDRKSLHFIGDFIHFYDATVGEKGIGNLTILHQFEESED